MTLTDTGPLVALLDRDEPDHTRCVEQTPKLECSYAHDMASLHGSDVPHR